jgi:TonB-dependent starch-binding outer membrane protein SusC
VLTDEDKVSLGSPLPKVIYGFSLNLEYKGIDLAAQFTGTIGNKIFNGSKEYLYNYQDLSNRSADFADRYVDADIIKVDPLSGEPVLVTHQNLDTELPRNFGSNYQNPSDFYVEDGSYIRLRNITLGYTLPKAWTRLVNIESLRLYIGGRNLWTLTRYQGLNPEIGQVDLLTQGIDASIYPVTKLYTWGVNVTF